jgi:hypothetical protein
MTIFDTECGGDGGWEGGGLRGWGGADGRGGKGDEKGEVGTEERQSVL